MAGVVLLMTITGVIGAPGHRADDAVRRLQRLQRHTLTLLGIIVAGVIGDVLGASIAYAIGYYGRPRAARAPGQQAPRHRSAARPRAQLVRALRRAGRVRLALRARRPRGVPVRRRRRRDAVRAVRRAGGARLDLLDRRARACSAARSGSNWQNWRHHLEYVDYVGAARRGRGDRVPDRAPRARARSEPEPGRRCRVRRSGRTLPLGQALALGALHGPAELLPISSSGHVALVPWLLDWDYGELDDELRKSFEVALHAGTAAALLITLRDEVERGGPRARRAAAGADRAVVRAAGDRRLHARAADRAPPRDAARRSRPG